MTPFLQANSHSAWDRTSICPASLQPTQPVLSSVLDTLNVPHSKENTDEKQSKLKEMSLLQIKKRPQRTPAAELYCATRLAFSLSVTSLCLLSELLTQRPLHRFVLAYFRSSPPASQKALSALKTSQMLHVLGHNANSP